MSADDDKDAAYLREVAKLLDDDRSPSDFTFRRVEIRERLRQIADKLGASRRRH